MPDGSGGRVAAWLRAVCCVMIMGAAECVQRIRGAMAAAVICLRLLSGGECRSAANGAPDTHAVSRQVECPFETAPHQELRSSLAQPVMKLTHVHSEVTSSIIKREWHIGTWLRSIWAALLAISSNVVGVI